MKLCWRNLAENTGGKSLAETPADTFAHNLEERTAATPIWQWLILLAILLLPIDIAVRRLIITRSDLTRLRNYLFRGTPTQEPGRVSSLVAARDRARDRTQYGDSSGESDSVAALRRSRASRQDADSPAPIPNPPGHAKQPVTNVRKKEIGDKSPVKGGEGSTVNSLLKNRKRRQDDD